MKTVTLPCALSKVHRLFRHEIWNIGIIKKPIHTIVERGLENEIFWLPQTESGIFFADPFGIFFNGDLYILCEKFMYTKGIGQLTSIRITQDGIVEEQELDLHFSFHTAYPFLFCYDNHVYCVPETSLCSEVRLYRASKFPTKWEYMCSPIRGIRAVDVTVFHYNALWWMWFTDGTTGPNSDLYLWYSEHLFSKWIPHPSNPIKRCSFSSRSAGTPYVYNGRLFRPAQDCSRRYGAAITVNEITVLDTARYEEKIVARIAPNRYFPYSKGLHTLSSVDQYTLIDAKKITFIPQGFSLGIRKGSKFFSQALKQLLH